MLVRILLHGVIAQLRLLFETKYWFFFLQRPRTKVIILRLTLRVLGNVHFAFSQCFLREVFLHHRLTYEHVSRRWILLLDWSWKDVRVDQADRRGIVLTLIYGILRVDLELVLVVVILSH